MAQPKPTPRPKMGVIEMSGNYLLLPMSKAMDVFSILDEVIFLDKTWKDDVPYRYNTNRSQPTLTHISEEQLLLMDAKASLEE